MLIKTTPMIPTGWAKVHINKYNETLERVRKHIEEKCFKNNFKQSLSSRNMDLYFREIYSP